MEFILQFFDDLVTSGGVSKWWLSACVGIASMGILIFYLVKTVTHLNKYLKSPENTIAKEEIEHIKTTIQNENSAIFKILDDVRERIKHLEITGENAVELNRQIENEIGKINEIAATLDRVQDEEAKQASVARHDLNTLVTDSRAQYLEVSRQIQALQKDLASLQGTIIGMSTQRSRLK
jgi:chromosome segregation ATPase